MLWSDSMTIIFNMIFSCQQGGNTVWDILFNFLELIMEKARATLSMTVNAR